jgi:branched-chain amino acid aminotransferase
MLTYIIAGDTERNNLFSRGNRAMAAESPTSDASLSLPYDDRDGVIWFDGELVPWRDAKLHVLSHGLHYASCVFEGIRIYDSRAFKLDEHCERLIASARALGFELPLSAQDLSAATRETMAVQKIENGYIRPVAWRGSEMMGVSAQHNTIHVAIAIWAWGTYFKDRDQGIRMKLSPWRRPAPETAPVQSKAAGLYMICTLSKHMAEAEGYHDALMLDWRGQVAEATGANLFMVKDGSLHTPPPDCFLDGITRRTVMALARSAQIEVIERPIELDELWQADELFLTGTAAEVTPISEIEGHGFEVGPVTRQLMADYDAEVHKA